MPTGPEELKQNTGERHPTLKKVVRTGLGAARSAARRTMQALNLEERPSEVELIQMGLDAGIKNVGTVGCTILTRWGWRWQGLHDQGAMNLTHVGSEVMLSAFAAGVHIGSGGREKAMATLQNSGAGHIVDGKTSLLDTLDLPAFFLVTMRGIDPKDNSTPHRKIGAITESLFKAVFPKEDIYGRADGKGFRQDYEKALASFAAGNRVLVGLSPFAFRETYPAPEFKPRDLNPVEFMRRMDEIQERVGRSIQETYSRAPISREEAYDQIFEEIPEDAFVITGNGFDPRALFSHRHRDHNLYVVGNMGAAKMLALTMARVNPHRVFVALEGNENALQGYHAICNMTEGVPSNYRGFVLDNGGGVSVGGTDSLELPLDIYRFSKVIRTVPEGYGSFKAPRLEDGIPSKYASEAEMIQTLGPLPFHVRQVMHIIRQETDREIQRQERQSGIPPQIIDAFR